VRSDKDAITRCILLSTVFPSASIVVAVTTRRQGWDVWRKFCDAFRNEKIGLVNGDANRLAGRIIVGTVGQFCPAMVAGESILLAPYGEQMAQEKCVEFTVRMHFGRIYLCVRPRRRVDWRREITMEQMAGP